MLACMTEVASAAWRDGMIEGLTRGLAFAAEEDLHGRALTRALVRRFNHATPAAYHRYVQTYLHQEELYGVEPKMLSFWQWRYLAADLAEIVEVAGLLGCAPGQLEEEARAALLLADSEPSTAPAHSLREHGAPGSSEPHFHDGLVDAYSFCWQVLHDRGLDGVEYCARVMDQLDLFWPADYKLYRQRMAHARRLVRDERPGCTTPEDEWPLDYGAWAELVCELSAEVDRCCMEGERLSRRRRELCRRLLCEEYEPLPSRDWSAPASLNV